MDYRLSPDKRSISLGPQGLVNTVPSTFLNMKPSSDPKISSQLSSLTLSNPLIFMAAVTSASAEDVFTRPVAGA